MTDDGGNVRSAISNALVALMKEHYGKGPTRAKTYLNDLFVFSVLEDILVPSERTLVDRGEKEAVRTYRLTFQRAMEKEFEQAVAAATGRTVLAYHSQVLFDPDIAIEMFRLDAPAEG